MPSLISADVHIVGTLSAEGEMQIDGKVEGNVRAQRVVIGSSGIINGEIVAEEIVIRGEVNGPIRGRMVQFSAGARVVGDIVHWTIAMESGAAFEGNIRRSDNPLEEVRKLPSPAAAAKADRKLAKSRAAKSAVPASTVVAPEGDDYAVAGALDGVTGSDGGIVTPPTDSEAADWPSASQADAVAAVSTPRAGSA
jgi:cytoskeletal protein CcmA (bactofilin family)